MHVNDAGKSNKYIYTEDGKVYQKQNLWKNALSIFSAGASAGTVLLIGSTAAGKNEKSYKKSKEAIVKYDINNRNSISSAIDKMFTDKKADFAKRGIELLDYSEGIPMEASEQLLFEPMRRAKERENIRAEKKANRLTKHLNKIMDKYGESMTIDKYSTAIAEWEQKYPREAKRYWKTLEKKLTKANKNFEQYGCFNPDLYMQIGEKHPKLFKFLCKNSLELRAIKQMNTIYEGRNAMDHCGKLHINMANEFMSLPHETGHGLNYTSKGIFKLTNRVYSRPQIAIPLIVLTALFRRKKVEGEKSETAAGKTLDFVKNNSVALTAACFAPELVEEASASVKGHNLMKKYLNKEELKMIKRCDKHAFMSYFTLAAMFVGITAAINCVRDLISKPKEVKQI